MRPRHFFITNRLRHANIIHLQKMAPDKPSTINRLCRNSPILSNTRPSFTIWKNQLDNNSRKIQRANKRVRRLFSSRDSKVEIYGKPDECKSLAIEFFYIEDEIKLSSTFSGQFEYELILRPDLYTRRHTQWYYFRVQNMIANTTYRFRIINLVKKSSLYKEGKLNSLNKSRYHFEIVWKLFFVSSRNENSRIFRNRRKKRDTRLVSIGSSH